MVNAQKIKNVVKNSSVFGRVYYWLGIFSVKTLQLFIKPNSKQILFMSYSGRQFSDTPKEAYQQLRDDPAFSDYKLVWAFNSPKKNKHAGLAHVVNANSPFYFIHLLRSKYWISNSSIDRLIPFDHKKYVYIQFWHGVPMKTLGHAEHGLAPLVQHWYDHVKFDYLFTYGSYDTQKFKEVFPLTKRIVESGQLRKLIVKRYAKLGKEKIKAELGIKSDKPILLYVPTFRGYESTTQTKLSTGFLERMTSKYTVIYRGHYFSSAVQAGDIIAADSFSLYKLFNVADIMITDYSSVLFDFASMDKPIYLFQPDIEEYEVKRGLYMQGEELGLQVAHSEADIEHCLMENDFNVSAVKKLVQKFDPKSGEEALAHLKAIIYHG